MTELNAGAVTIVVATYGRPDALICALKSIMLQTYPHWDVLVVGDGCDAGTGEALKPFLTDPRFRFVNLPFRCGEQALPNSAGMAAAQTKWVALLNQDDVWLPWHLAEAIQALEAGNADFLIARSAWSWGHSAEGRDLPVLHGVSPANRSWQDIFQSGFHVVEPASSWVVQRSVIERVGHWHSAVSVYRPPIQDWCLRAWRAGARMINGTRVSCIKFETQWAAGSPARRYDLDAHPQSAWVRHLEDCGRWPAIAAEMESLCSSPSAIGRGMMLDAAQASSPRVKSFAGLLLTSEFADFYHRTGLDSYTWLCAHVELEKGFRWRTALKARTGEHDLQPPDPDTVVAYVKSDLIAQRMRDADE